MNGPENVSAGEYAALSRLRRRARDGQTQREGNPMGAIFNIFPLILVPVLIYNIWAFGATAAGTTPEDLRNVMEATKWFSVPMASQEDGRAVQWIVTGGDMLILLSLVLLFIELLKSTSTGTAAIFNHALSMLVFIICLVEFLLHPAFATTVFFLILVMSLLDVLAGVVVTIISARRDVEFDRGSH